MIQLAGSAPLADRHMYRITNRYKDVDFRGKRVLDIGGGLGLISYYASIKGASAVVCLDPGDDGAIIDLNAESMRLQQAMQTDTVSFLPLKLQEYDPDGALFDVIIMSSSINHIDEAACERLPDDPEARQSYREIFQQIASMSKPNGRLLVSDVSPRNFYARLGVRNPFAPTIEWHKHQPPDVWIDLMAQVGYADFKVRWLSLPRFGRFGEIALSNKLGAYVINSAFMIDCVLRRK
jgi:SAM-dependent methyltransferase